MTLLSRYVDNCRYMTLSRHLERDGRTLIGLTQKLKLDWNTQEGDRQENTSILIGRTALEEIYLFKIAVIMGKKTGCYFQTFNGHTITPTVLLFVCMTALSTPSSVTGLKEIEGRVPHRDQSPTNSVYSRALPIPSLLSLARMFQQFILGGE